MSEPEVLVPKAGGVPGMPEITSIEEMERLAEPTPLAHEAPFTELDVLRARERALRRDMRAAGIAYFAEVEELQDRHRALQRQVRVASALCFLTTVGIAGLLMGWWGAVAAGIGVGLGLVWFSEVGR